MALLDALARPLRDLRISVTDRCNLRCAYCMPREIFGADYAFLDQRELLTYEEIARLARLFVALGAGKIRLTGGEPLLRRNLERLIAQLAAIDGVRDLSMTTNGLLLPGQAALLAGAGLQRVSVSLDTLDEAVFQRMNGTGATVERVLDGIAAAERAGLRPIKINAVVQRGVNDHTLVDLARRFRGSGHVVRFIENMDVGNSNGWRLDQVVTAAEIVDRLAAVFPLEPREPHYRGEVAGRWRYRDGEGEIGVISSVSQPFCGDCTRARLSPEGKLFTCLFAEDGLDLRSPLRAGADDEALLASMAAACRARRDRYSEQRSSLTQIPRKIEMSHIGG
jgi:cyclic pyranopterin phosphate synthase